MKLDATRVDEFEKYVQSFMEEHSAPGLVVAIAQGEDVIYSKSFGLRDKEEKLPTTEDTIFGIASITKSFTAVAVAQLVEAGKLSFSDPIERHLPEFRLKGKEASGITVHHLLSHTSGMPPLPTLGYSIRGNTVPDARDDGSKPEVDVTEPRMNTIGDIIQYMAETDIQLFGEPGEFFSYSNDCYGLLGAIITRISGVPYQRYIEANILRPLGMDRTLFSYEALTEFDNVTALYYKNEKEALRCSHKWQVAPPFIAGGWMKSTALDLLRFFQMLANGGSLQGQRIVSLESIRANMSHQHRFSLYDAYAHGLRIREDYHGSTLAEHGGSLKGVSSNGGFVPEKRVSAVVLCNLTGVPVARVWLRAINLVLGLPLETPRAGYALSDWHADAADKFVGLYKSGEGAELEILKEDAKLMVKFKTDECVLHRVTDTVGLIVLKGVEQEIRFYCDESGRAWGLGYGVRIIPRA